MTAALPTTIAQISSGPITLGQVNETKLGAVLIEQSLISQDQLQQALKLQQQTGDQLGQLTHGSAVLGKRQVFTLFAH